MSAIIAFRTASIEWSFTDSLTNSPDATKAQYFFADEHGKQIITEPLTNGAVAIEVADAPGHKPDLAYVDRSNPDNSVKYRDLDQFECELGTLEPDMNKA